MRPSKLGLYLCLVFILCLGMTTIWSIAPDLFTTQLAFAIAGIIIIFLLSKADLNLLFSIGWGWYFLSIFLLILTALVGKNIRGSVRWIDLGLFGIQTSELIKPLLALFYAQYLSKANLKPVKNFLFFLGLSLVPVLLVARQPDLGSALTLLAFPLMLLVFTGHIKRLVIFALIGAAVILPLEAKLLKPYQRQRIDSFINPYKDPKGAGYNVIQATIAVGSGGVIGKGIKLGTQSHLNFLPERHTDFIFASFAEELGFIGIVMLLGAYTYVFLKLLSFAKMFKNERNTLFSMAIFSIFFFQTVVNVGMNLGIMPVTGITLPIFSYGGSSLLSFAILTGIQLRLLDLITPFEL